MDDLLLRELERIYSRHRVPIAAREALGALIEAALDPRLQFTADLGFTRADQPSAPPPAPTGQAGFEDLGRLGLGGMGEVRRVRETALGRVVAMKVSRAGTDPSWLEREARLTASLNHPGVLPIYQLGRLPDGRPYFTVREAVGRTLREALDDPEGRTQRQLLDALRRVAEAVASAHAEGVVHRDLKPENILLGEYGAVWVLDWGIAGPAGEVPAGLTGSPRYMAPEQILRQAVGNAADVWALGAILFEILSGRPAFPGSADAAMSAALRGPPALSAAIEAGLAAIVARALVLDPAARWPDAGAFAHALGRWLDGATAREEGLEILHEAHEHLASATAARATGQDLLASAERRLAAIPSWAPPEDKVPAWDEEEQGRRAKQHAIELEERAVELAQRALQRAPELGEAHDLLAEHFRERLVDAEERADPSAARLELRLRAHDRGQHSVWLRGDGALTLHSDPPGARVLLAPLMERQRRLVPGEAVEIGRTPLTAHAIPRGRWLVTLLAEGRVPVRYPVRIDRAQHWDGVPPGGHEPWPIYLPTERELGPDECYVPASWAWLRQLTATGITARDRWTWVDSFGVRRLPVTHGEWLTMLNALVADGQPARAAALAPLERHQRGGSQEPVAYRFDGATWSLGADVDGDLWTPDQPAFLITWHQAHDYAAALAELSGTPWRMLRSAEYEKAARGTDGRLYPWGTGSDGSYAATRASRPPPARPISVHSNPVDESVYGVRALAGCIRTWLEPLRPSGDAENRGSYWNAAGIAASNCTLRYYDPPYTRSVATGLRLARDLGPRYTR